MPRNFWTSLLTLLIGTAAVVAANDAMAFQRGPQLSDPIHTRPIHDPGKWNQRGFTSQGPFNQSPADYGPAIGMSSRTPTGNPASGDQFPVMRPGSLPGGLAPHGFNSSGMNPPVNQPDKIANNPIFGGPGSHQQGPNGFGQNGNGKNGAGSGNGPNRGFADPRMNGGGGNTRSPFGPGTSFRDPTTSGSSRPRMQMAATSAMAGKPAVVGLLGQFARPGAYDLGAEPLMLAQLIEQVGGMSKDAAGQLKVIRNGHPGQSLTIAGADQFELMAGDLVIAESTPDANRSQAGDSNPQGANPSAGPNRSSSGVQIGFLNLLDRPVVLKLRSEHASVAAILNIMQQDTSLAGKVQVILPSSHRFSGRVHPNMPLPSESVVMFPPNVVATDRLAGLPAPTKVDTAANRDSADPTQPGMRLPNPNSIGQTPLGMRSSDAPSADNEVPAPPTEAIPTTTGGLPESGRRVSKDTVGAGHETTESDDSANVPPLPILDADEPTRFNTPGQQKPIDVLKSSDQSELDSLEVLNTAEANPSGWWKVAPLVIIALSLSGLLVLSLWLRRRTVAERQAGTVQLHRRRIPSPAVAANRPTEPQRPAVSQAQSTIRQLKIDLANDEGRLTLDTANEAKRPVPSSARITLAKQALLESLIQNQVPMTEEHVVFSSPMQFHGRPNAPQLVRVDAGHAIPKPHVPAVDATEPQPLIREPLAKGPTRMDRSAKVSAPVSNRSAFERALSNVRAREERS